MADSLFDNRYRYDYIYPRGRSGETLRAVDTEDKDRKVVIKRPAPNDAPPIRAGQEVSIQNERKALSRLSGHAVLTALLEEGQFFVGNMPHRYIVMERAEGMIIEEKVLELAASGSRLPELEMLVVIDSLLDLLQAAHNHDIVYNDVDAKHLFWNRDIYKLKVIDWGNAVFLEGDEVTPQGISRQSDVFQVGELLFFILTGGKRVEIPRDAGENFAADFGEDSERVHSRLQEIISRALHPNPRLRYQSVLELRRDLTQYRAPLERERNTIVERVTERLKRLNLSKTELATLLAALEPGLALDPGYPPAREAHDDIVNRLRDLEVSADLDAVRIYMESGNWSRSADLLNELRDKAGAKTAGLVKLLLDCCVMLMDNEQISAPRAVTDAITLMFDRKLDSAARVLLTTSAPNEAAWNLQWQIAERMSSHIPEILLLRPNLFRLQTALAQLNDDGINVQEQASILSTINTVLDAMASSSSANLRELRDGYRSVVDHLNTLARLLPRLRAQHNLSNRRLPLTSMDRALLAAMALADNMHVIGKQATSSPRDATTALNSSRTIDPMNPLWDAISQMLNRLYEHLQTCQTYVPAADGSDLQSWLLDTRRTLEPFVQRLFDELLGSMVHGLENASRAWDEYSDAVIVGDRIGAIDTLTDAVQAVSTLSPTLAGWLNQLRNVVTGARYVERHAVIGGLGRALADGWEAFDRGRFSDAERLGQQALEIARSETHSFAARRLLKISQIARDWVERNGVNSVTRTQAAMENIERLFTDDESAVLEHFTNQMPSTETYLRAMSKGLVEIYAQRSTAALRVLFIYYIMLGTLDAHDRNLVDAAFWREAAVKSLGESGARNAATLTLDEFITRRRDINSAVALFGKLNGKHALSELENTRRQLEENAQARTLAAGIHSVRELEASLRDWTDGEFRAAGAKLDNALHAIGEVEQTAGITLTGYRAWLMDLQAAVADLHVKARTMAGLIEKRPTEPDPTIRETHHHQVEVTERLLGADYAATMRQWRDTYETFLGVYMDPEIRRSKKLERFNELFHALFIDRHPAYDLYRHWYGAVEGSSEFPAPPTSEPTPRIREEEDDLPQTAYSGSRYADDEDESDSPKPSGTSRRNILGGGAIVLVILVGALVILSGALSPSGPSIDVTITDTPDTTATEQALAIAMANLSETPPTVAADTDVGSDTPDAAVSQQPTISSTVDTTIFNTPTLTTPTSRPDDTATPTPTTPAPTDTPSPTETPSETPTDTLTPTITYTPSNTPTITPSPLPEGGVRGTFDLLRLFEGLETLPWREDQFAFGHDGTYWRMGVAEATDGDILYISPPAELLEEYLGNNAVSRISRMEVDLNLRTHNPNIVADDDIYFGALFQSMDDGNNAGLRVQRVQATAINLSQMINNTPQFITQRSVNNIIVSIRLDRDPVSGAVTTFLNNRAEGQVIEFIAPDADVLPTLFVKDGGVVIGVTAWRITLR